MSLLPIKIDCQNIRTQRQKLNNLLVFNSIKEKDIIFLYNGSLSRTAGTREGSSDKEKPDFITRWASRRLEKVWNIKSFHKNINENEFKRVLEENEITEEKLHEECLQNDLLNKILSGRISKNSSRQGTKDENLQLFTCNILSNKLGIKIENLSVNEYRPDDKGNIVYNSKISKDYLKSFDGKISGKIAGWIFSKIVYGNGGHQDNVFYEAHCLCEWIKKFDKKELFVFLIDTDLERKINTLKRKYFLIKNILIVNHFEFQEYLIKNYKS